MAVLRHASIVNGISVASHPVGIETQVKHLAKHASDIPLTKPPGRILVLGASSGYGFASWLISVFGAKAKTIGVFLEKSGISGETATAGWYNVGVLGSIAKDHGYPIRAVNADVFSLRTKRQVAEIIRRDFEKIDCIIYSIAAPKRLDPETNVTYHSTIKPINESFISRDINIETGYITTTIIPPATEEEINTTIKVMGGEDWYSWIEFLLNEGLLEKGCQTFAYSYIGGDITAPIYRNGTIGRAKEHLEQTSLLIHSKLQKEVNGKAFTAVTRAIVTQASSAIPSLTLYLSCLFYVAKETNTHEDCFDQIARLFRQIYGNDIANFDDQHRLRLDDKELDSKVQKAVKQLTETITDQTVHTHSDYVGYRRNFLQLYGFEVPGVDYNASIETSMEIPTDNTYQISDIALGKTFIDEYNNVSSETTSSNVVIAGIGCQFAGARNPRELWINSLCKRQQFRNMPPQRFSCDDYYDPNPDVPDKTYSRRAALIDGFKFNWNKRRIPKETYESTDIIQWLALEAAEAALEDAALDWKNINRDRVGVYVGNTLGEFTRASNEMRPRWSYIQSAFLQAAKEVNYDINLLLPIVEAFEHYYKINLPNITKDSVAGELANVVAGRISNYFDFHGGAYTVDAACASSLIAIINAVKALQSREIDVAIAGGVDITLGTAFMVGFAKAGVFAKERMRVFDQEAEGFVPGEGAGFVVLKRKFDADCNRDKQYAEILGYGISTDGKGGIATPNVKGQLLALKRAYKMAKISPLQLDFIEAHGTGTSVGDSTEVTAIKELLLSYQYDKNMSDKKQLALSSIKSTIGHTKGAAGVAGFIEAAIGLNQREIPPIAGCVNPNKVFEENDCGIFPAIHTIKKPVNSRMLAGVSSMGFGGINAHVVLASAGPKYHHLVSNKVSKIVYDSADQLTELFIFSAPTPNELLAQLENLYEEVSFISYGELVDLSCFSLKHVKYEHAIKASLAATSPTELAKKISLLISWIKQKTMVAGDIHSDPIAKVYLGFQPIKPRIGFVFPGQGSQQLNPGIKIIERYSWAREIAEDVIAHFFSEEKDRISAWEKIFVLKETAKDKETLKKWQKEIATPSMSSCVIAISWLVWYEFLIRLGISPDLYMGHSYGDYMSLYAAGGYNREDLLKLIYYRSELVLKYSNNSGGMVSLQCNLETATELLSKVTGIISIANINAPDQIVLSGEESSIKMLAKLALELGVKAKILPVTTAFHSTLLDGARKKMISSFPLENITFNPTKDKKIILSLTGQLQEKSLAIKDYLANHFVTGVQFVLATDTLSKEIDLAIEVGTGRVVSGLLAANNIKIYNYSVEKQSGDSSIEELLAFLYTRGIEINWEMLFAGRHYNPYIPPREKNFLESPFSKIKTIPLRLKNTSPFTNVKEEYNPNKDISDGCYQLLINKIVKLSGFDPASIKPEYHLLNDLGFDSISVARLSKDIASDIGVNADKLEVSTFQTKNITEIAQYLETFKGSASSSHISPTQSMDIYELLINKIASLSGFDPTSINSEHHLLNDLGFDSILVARLSKTIASDIGIDANKIEIASFHNKTIAEIADHLKSISNNVGTKTQLNAEKTKTLNRPHLVRNYIMIPYAQPLALEKSVEISSLGKVLLIEPNAIKLDFAFDIKRRWCPAQLEEMGNALVEDHSKTNLIVVIHQMAETDLITQLWMASQFVENIASISFLVLGNLPLPNGFVKSISLEYPRLKLRALRFKQETKLTRITQCLADELATAENIVVASYLETDSRYIWYPKVISPIGNRPWKQQIGAQDIVLVTGGGKGITAECALKLAAKTGGIFVLLGRSQTPAPDIMQRFAKQKIQAIYYSCDVQNRKELENTVSLIENTYGTITAVIHGAGINKPRRTITVTLEEAKTEMAPKLEGMQHLCDIFNKNTLRFFVVFSSVAAVTGLPGNAWYAFSNQMIEEYLKRYQSTHPNTEILALCYGVWNEIGMGVSTNAVSKLSAMGIDSLSVEEGTTRFVDAITTDQPNSSLVITPSLGDLATWNPCIPNLSIKGRFLEHIHKLETDVYGVCIAKLSLKKDLYLNDHCFGKNILFPTVFGLEAMAEVAALVLNTTDMPQRFENVLLNRAIVIDKNKEYEIRIVIIADEPKNTEIKSAKAEIFYEDDDFTKPCFESQIFFAPKNKSESLTQLELPIPLKLKIDNLYQQNGVFFHGEFYRRIGKVYKLDLGKSTFLVEINSKPYEMWHKSCFDESIGSHQLLLGDIAVLDTMLQTSGFFTSPTAALPVAIEKLIFSHVIPNGSIYAEGTVRQNTDHIYNDLILRTVDGQIICRMNNYQSRLLHVMPKQLSAKEIFDISNSSQQRLSIKELFAEKINTFAKSVILPTNFLTKLYRQTLNPAKWAIVNSCGIMVELLACFWFFRLCNGKIKFHESLPNGSFIIAANHVSYADWLILYSLFNSIYKRKIYFLAKEKLYKNFWWRILMRYSNSICVEENCISDNSKKAINMIVNENQHIIGIFPEGTRSKNGKLNKGYDGAAQIALANNIPIVPIGLKGFYEMWPSHRKLPKRAKIEINFGRTIHPDNANSKLSSITKQIMHQISILTDQKYDFEHEN